MATLGSGQKLVIGALHLPPFPGTQRAKEHTLKAIEEFAVANAEVFAAGGISGLYIQESGAGGAPRVTSAETVAYMTAVGRAVRQVFAGPLGVIIAAHGAEAPLAIAHAIDGQFVRLKVYCGAMIKAEGLVQGCAHEAVQFREKIGATRIALVADVYDRTGVPLGEAPIEEAATWAARFASADALVLTGHTFSESLEFIKRVRARDLGVPLLVGGSVTAENIRTTMALADGVIVSSSLKYPEAANSHKGIVWDIDRIRQLMSAVSDHI